ncbi:MAG: cytochrome b561 domain-containing protein [Roseobacter sp.]
MDWLLAPIDPARVHEVGFAVSWHARVMVLSWGILAPLAVFAARFFKVVPGQDWPNELDNQAWWKSHWMGQTAVVVLSFVGLVLVLPSELATMSLHNWLGYGVLVGGVAQILLGLMRGSKGGPTAPAPDGSLRGHHYDMTPWRLMFEALHKTIGYGTLLLAVLTIVLGLWKANAPVWMWCALFLWWIGLITAFVGLQKRGMAVDTYQAIWGADPSHPGNQRGAPGWGMRRSKGCNEGKDDVRRHRGNRVRSH